MPYHDYLHVKHAVSVYSRTRKTARGIYMCAKMIYKPLDLGYTWGAMYMELYFQRLWRSMFACAGIMMYTWGSSQGFISGTITFDPLEVTSLEEDFFRDLDDNTLDRYTLADAFLIASGIITEPDFSRYREKLDRVRAQARAEVPKIDDPYENARTLLQWMHEKALTSYRANATLATDILDFGRFDCLTASILYALLAQDAGLRVDGVIVPDHAFCVLRDPRSDKDIETTVRYGFDPGTKEIQQLEKTARYIYIPPREYRQRETVSLRRLIACLYSNRISILQHGKGLARRDLAKYKKGYYLDPDSTLLKENIAASFNNLAIESLRHGNLADARSYIDQGYRFSPSSDVCPRLEVQFYNTRAERESRGGRYDLAIAALQEGRTRFPDEHILTRNLVYYYDRWAASCAHRGDGERARAVYREGLAAVPDNSLLTHNIKASFYNDALTALRRKDSERALRLAREGLSVSPSDSDLKNLEKTALKMTDTGYRTGH